MHAASEGMETARWWRGQLVWHINDFSVPGQKHQVFLVLKKTNRKKNDASSFWLFACSTSSIEPGFYLVHFKGKCLKETVCEYLCEGVQPITDNVLVSVTLFTIRASPPSVSQSLIYAWRPNKTSTRPPLSLKCASDDCTLQLLIFLIALVPFSLPVIW